MEETLCPMRPYKTNTIPPKTEFSPCIGFKCEWFGNEKCSIKEISSLAQEISGIVVKYEEGEIPIKSIDNSLASIAGNIKRISEGY